MENSNIQPDDKAEIQRLKDKISDLQEEIMDHELYEIPEALRLAYIDSLAGCYSRTYFKLMNKKYVDPIADNNNIVITFFDINNLKKANDTIGYDVGDRMIIDNTAHIKNRMGIEDIDNETIGKEFKITGDEFKSHDVLVRMGGDEFALVHYKTKEEQLNENFKSEYDDMIVKTIYQDKPDTFDSAWGSSVFDNKIDKDIFDTAARSGVDMHKRKAIMKAFMQ